MIDFHLSFVHWLIIGSVSGWLARRFYGRYMYSLRRYRGAIYGYLAFEALRLAFYLWGIYGPK